MCVCVRPCQCLVTGCSWFSMLDTKIQSTRLVVSLCDGMARFAVVGFGAICAINWAPFLYRRHFQSELVIVLFEIGTFEK